MMEIFWTMLASQDRKRIREYIAEQNLMVAIELDERIGYFGRTYRLTPGFGGFTSVLHVTSYTHK